MLVYIYGFLSAILAVMLETFFRSVKETSYLNLLPITLLPAVGINYCIYKMVIYAKTYLEAFIVFPFCTATLRLFVSFFILTEPVSSQILFAYGLIVLAQIIKA